MAGKKKKVEEYKGEIGEYKIIGVAKYTDEEGNEVGELEIGSVQKLPKSVGEQFVADGVAEEVKEVDTSDTSNQSAPVEVVKQRYYEGKLVISEIKRVVNEKTYYHVRLADGSTQDLTSEQLALIEEK